MPERIILSLVAIAMLVLTYKKGDKMTAFLTAGLTLAIILTWSAVPLILSVALMIYLLTALVIALVNLKSQSLSTLDRATIVVSGFVAFGAKLFFFMHWPHVEWFRIIGLIPIALYLMSLYKGMANRKEFGYATILNLEFVFRILIV